MRKVIGIALATIAACGVLALFEALLSPVAGIVVRGALRLAKVQPTAYNPNAVTVFALLVVLGAAVSIVVGQKGVRTVGLVVALAGMAGMSCATSLPWTVVSVLVGLFQVAVAAVEMLAVAIVARSLMTAFQIEASGVVRALWPSALIVAGLDMAVIVLWPPAGPFLHGAGDLARMHVYYGLTFVCIPLVAGLLVWRAACSFSRSDSAAWIAAAGICAVGSSFLSGLALFQPQDYGTYIRVLDTAEVVVRYAVAVGGLSGSRQNLGSREESPARRAGGGRRRRRRRRAGGLRRPVERAGRAWQVAKASAPPSAATGRAEGGR